MKLSIIIVNYNVRFFLEQAIRSALKASINLESEIIVVDNASKDGSKEMVEHTFPEITYIYLNENFFGIYTIDRTYCSMEKSFSKFYLKMAQGLFGLPVLASESCLSGP